MPALFGLLQRGGPLMIPLCLFSILTLWIFLERLYHLRRADGKAASLYAEVCQLMARGDRAGAVLRARARPGPVAAVFCALLKQPQLGKADLEELATLQARKELQRLTIRLPLLNLIAALAPLTGLLGTVLGMVQAFHKVATAQGESNEQR